MKEKGIYDEYDEYKTRLENLPTFVRGLCYHDDDGNCYIILNARHTHATNKHSYLHEIQHIHRGDMYDMNYREYPA